MLVLTFHHFLFKVLFGCLTSRFAHSNARSGDLCAGCSQKEEERKHKPRTFSRTGPPNCASLKSHYHIFHINTSHVLDACNDFGENCPSGNNWECPNEPWLQYFCKSWYKWEVYRDTNWWCMFYFPPRGGQIILLQTHLDRNGGVHRDTFQRYPGWFWKQYWPPPPPILGIDMLPTYAIKWGVVWRKNPLK